MQFMAPSAASLIAILAFGAVASATDVQLVNCALSNFHKVSSTNYTFTLTPTALGAFEAKAST